MDDPSRRLKLSELAEQFNLQYHGNGETMIEGVGTLSEATGSQLSFLSNPTYRDQLATTRAAAVLVSASDAEYCPVNVLIADDPYVSYAKIATRFDPKQPLNPGIHPSSSIDPGTTLGSNIHVGANAVIGPGCEIADAVIIGPGCVLTANCTLGAACHLEANVTLCDGVVIGKRSIVHSGAVIGADGFGLAFDQDHWVKIPQLGVVRIGNDCEIGANTTIDRGAIGDTVLEDDVRLDNQVQIGHNVHIGAHTAMAGRVGISGSTQIGKYCMFAGASGAVGHIRIADRTTVNFCSVVSKSILQPGTVWSAALPAQPLREWNRSVAHLRKLEKLARRVLRLEKSTREKTEK
ncbi:MAG: UDP-3-O-(3-hydroxymyristoyl)glucosamine N-acyltransferase [Gammaproteobacteria bacterium]|nr:MAG: UDP-3-O-(3-hydroxymyristoyl)glucosamine N-acyltransferase [Gammaproteobacteria bacterium]